MKALEHRIPPPVVVLAIGLLMWTTARHTPQWSLAVPWRLTVSGVIFALGLLVGGSGVLAFRSLRTTIDPVNLESATALVTTGIFQISRNPMYVGFTALLSAWAIYLASPWALVGPVIFVLFTRRFQILPEERVLRAKFGRPYEDYQQRVRRWI